MTRFQPFFSLRTRLILLVLLALLPALGIMLYTAAETRQREAEQVRAEVQTLTQLAAGQEEQLIEATRQVLLSLAQLPEVQRGNTEACSIRLAELLAQYQGYSTFAVANLDGNLVCSSTLLTTPVNVADRPWFRLAVETRDFAVGEYQVGRIDNSPILVFGYPVLDAAGQVQAVISASLHLGQLNQLATEAELPNEAILLIVDRKGVIVSRQPGSETWVGQSVPDLPLVQRMLSAGRGVAEVAGVDGVTRLYAFTPLRSTVKTGLSLAIGLPTEIAFAEANQILNRNLIWLGLVGLLALLATGFGGEVFVLRRVKALVNATERLRSGDLSARTGLAAGGAELGYLARAFDEMAATLEQREAERQRTEEVIREQREWLRVTLSSIGDAVITTDTQSRVTFINPVAQALTGWSEAAAMGQPLEKVFHIYNETTRAMAESPVTKVIREGAVVGLANHTILIKPDGQEIPIDDSGAPIRNEQGQINGVVLVFRDITDRRQAELELQESEKRFRMMADTAPVLIWMSGQDTLYTFFNKPWLDFTGRTMEQELGNGWTEGVHPDDYERCLEIYLSNFRARQKFEMEYRLRRADGEYRWVVDMGIPRYEGDNFVGYIGSCLDITERKQAEEAVRDQRELLRVTLASIGDAVIATNTQAEITFMNPVAEALTGWSQAEVNEKPLAEIFNIINEHTRQAVDNPAFKSLREGVVVGLANHTLLIRKDGTEIPIDDSSAPIRDEPGNLRGAVLVFRDITERRRTQQALEAQRAFLRQVIDINPNFIFAKDREGRFTLVNQAVAEAYGATVEELIGKTDADFNSNAAEVEHFRHDDLEVMDSLQEKFIPEEAVTDAAGKVRWLQTVKRPLIAPDGRITQLLGVSTDISERKRIEEELRISRDQLTIILQGVADGITVQDKTGRLVYANDAAARMTGYPSAQAMLEAPLQELMQKFKVLDESGQPFPLAQMPGRLALQGELTPSATVRFQVVATGEEHWSYVKARPIFDEQGQVELAINIFQDITELKRSEQAQRFLAEAGTLLASSLNYEVTLASIANLAVPGMADWCAVDILQEDETVQRLAVAHIDPAKVELAHELQRRYPTDWDSPTGVPNVLRTGQSEFYPEITDAMLEAGARDDEHLRLARELQLRSAMAVPLKVRGRTLGVITFVWAESGRRYEKEDLALAEELAHRAALAVDNARLYQEAQRLNVELEQRVSQRTAELQATNKILQSEIAERRRAEAQLRQQKEFSESLINSSFDGILAFDRECRYTVWNQAMERLTGVSKADTLGKNAFDIFPFLREIGEDQYFFEALAGQTTAVADRPYRVAETGRQGFFEGHYSPIQDISGQVVGGLGVIRDITRRKNMEAELDEIQRQLVQSRERDRLLLGRELHDGPVQDLYGVAFGLEAFKETVDPASLAQFKVMQMNLWQVISTLRFISSELRPQTLTPFGLEKAILSHVERFQETHPELGVKLELMPDGQILPEGTRLTLFRIYQELLNNAAQHAKASQIFIRFILDAEHVILEVEDNGQGFEIPERWIELARRGQLGLVETLERAEAIGGEMKVVSASGEGALIRVTVPRPDIKEASS